MVFFTFKILNYQPKAHRDLLDATPQVLANVLHRNWQWMSVSLRFALAMVTPAF